VVAELRGVSPYLRQGRACHDRVSVLSVVCRFLYYVHNSSKNAVPQRVENHSLGRNADICCTIVSSLNPGDDTKCS